MLNEAQNRANKYLEASAKVKANKTTNPKPVKAKKSKSSKNPSNTKTPADLKAFNDNLEAQLAPIAEKYGVKISLQRNKTKLSTINISGLKSLTFDKVADLFLSIPNTSPIPQKFSEDTATFRVFNGPPPSKRKSIKPAKTLTAKSDEYMPVKEKEVLLKRTKKALKETYDKYKESKSKQDKDHYKRVCKSLASNIKLLTASEEPKYIVTAKRNGKRLYWNGEDLKAVIASEAKILNEEEADKIERRLTHKEGFTDIKTVPMLKHLKADDNSPTDDSDLDDPGDSSEDKTNKADMIKYINDNKISTSDLGSLIDKASSSYADSLKSEAPISDIVDFIYSMLGADDSKNGLKAIANKTSMTKTS